MARLPALIETLEVFHPHLDAAAIRYAARALREGQDLLSAGAGGRGAPHMTPRDAVNLMLALNLANAPSRYANAALLGSGLARANDEADGASWPIDSPGVVVEVMAARTLGHALHVLIERAEELSPPVIRTDPFLDPAPGKRAEGRPAVDVEIVQQGDDLLARVTMFWRGPGGARRAERRYGVRAARASYGRWTTVHFDQALFLALKRTVLEAPPWAFAAEPSS